MKASVKLIAGTLLIVGLLMSLGSGCWFGFVGQQTEAGPGIHPTARSPVPIFSGVEAQLTTDPADQFDPAISGPIVVYTDRRGDDADIYYYDVITNTETQITSGEGDQYFNDVSWDRIVYTDYSEGNAEIIMYDITTGVATNISNHPANQLRPAISGDLVAWEDDRNGSPMENYDIYLYDLSTGTTTQVTNAPSHQRRPCVSGSIVAWEDYRYGNPDIFMADVSTSPPTVTPVTTNLAYDKEPDVDGDIITWESNRDSVGDVFYYRISTGQTVAVTSGPEYERNAAISGKYIAYENYGGEDANIWIYSIPYAAAVQVTTDPAEQFLHDLSWRRLVYTDERNENQDIYMFEFEFGVPALQVSPSEYNFGDVAVGTSETMVFTLTNVGDATLTLQDLVMTWFDPEETPSIQSGPAVPMDIPPDATYDVDLQVVFAPTMYIDYSAVLGIYSNDPVNPYIAVPLDGTGVEYEPSPQEEVEEVLDYIDTSVDAGNLEGNGPGNSANNRLQALVNMIEAAGDLIAAGSYEEACTQLWSAYLKCDGDTPPPDFVSGQAAEELAQMIQDIRADLGCSSP